MGRKHSKNAGVMGSEALTYHERKMLGHGMSTERLGKVRGEVCLADGQASASAFLRWVCRVGRGAAAGAGWKQCSALHG